MFSAYHAKYFAHELTRRNADDGVGRLSQSLFDASVDLNPHQIEAALFALRNPLQEGVLLADEVGLGKTIEASLVVCQYWAERRRRLLIICPASLRKTVVPGTARQVCRAHHGGRCRFNAQKVGEATVLPPCKAW